MEYVYLTNLKNSLGLEINVLIRTSFVLQGEGYLHIASLRKIGQLKTTLLQETTLDVGSEGIRLPHQLDKYFRIENEGLTKAILRF